MNHLAEQLDAEPALAWKMAVEVRGREEDSAEATGARSRVREAAPVKLLLDSCDPHSVYKKWDGAHWVLSILADLGYPPGEAALRPLMERTFETWLSRLHEKHILQIDGRTRRCASQEGNAAWSSLRLGMADARTDELVSRLLKWQWPDGGWNCDKHPQADTSSFMETLIPLRALALYARLAGDGKAGLAAERAAEIFLSRHLYKRLRDGSVMDKHFLRLSYPAYWHYHILFGLKVMAEAGFIADPRCDEGLDLLESKRLPQGGFPAEEFILPPDEPNPERLHPGALGRDRQK